MVRKPSPAQAKLLMLFPEDYKSMWDNSTLPGTMCYWDWPKGVNRESKRRLYRDGYITHSFYAPDTCPVKLTEQGKRFIAKFKEQTDAEDKSDPKE